MTASKSRPIAALLIALVFILAAVGPASAMSPKGAAASKPAGPAAVASGSGGAAAGNLEIPEGMTAEEALRFVAQLPDADARVLLLREIEARRAAAAGGAGGPTGLAVVLVKFRMWLDNQTQLLAARSGLVAQGFADAPAAIAKVLRGLSPEHTWGAFWLAAALAALFVGLGIGAHRAIHRATAGFRASLQGDPPTGFVDRIGRLTLRALLDLVALAAFAVVSFGLTAVFYADDRTARAFVFTYVTAGLVILAMSAASRFLFAPSAPNLRIVALSDGAAGYLHRSLMLLTGVGSVIWLTTAFLILTGGPPLGVHLALVLTSGAIVLGLFIVLVWRVREPVAHALAPGGDIGPPEMLPGFMRVTVAQNWHVLLVGYVLVIAVLWTISMLSRGQSVLWPAIGSIAIVVLLPLVDRGMQRAIASLVDALVVERYAPTGISMGGEEEDAHDLPAVSEPDPEVSKTYTGTILRAARILLLALAVIALLQLWDVDILQAIGARGADAIWLAAFDIGVTLLLAYVLWQLAETALTRKGARRASVTAGQWEDGSDATGEPSAIDVTDDERQALARARTLLPLIRRFILVVLTVIVVMIALSSIGVDIGPLLAGAGVVGLAIGFGAQALVRDIVSGVFFLIDDAFRVGEYIEIDENIRGEVERISLRSMQLRHHRGSLLTLPFGELRSITNHNRDWVIYKMPFRVPPETDPQQVKKIVKKIGAEMMDDPVLGPKLIQPLKSQGVFAIDDDSSLIIRVKFMCKPREQFVLRREAYHRIQKAFEAAGIEFARRKVEVEVASDATEEEIAAAAAEAVQEKVPSGKAAGSADAM